VTSLAPDGQWLAGLRARADLPPATPRQPLWGRGVRIGSVAPETMQSPMLLDAPEMQDALRPAAPGEPAGWHVQGDLTASLAVIARALHGAGLAQAWRDEQLAVGPVDGAVDGTTAFLATVERAAVRPLGIATHAVHLAGGTADGGHWVQRRALTKPNDPGLWDTLMGGMVPAADTLREALARETWEEAGLRLPQLQGLVPGGRVSIRRPTMSGKGWGYVVEHIDWFRCTLPPDVVPANQDGEVDEFRLMRPAEVLQRLQAEQFTLEAALVLCAAGL